MCTGDSIFLAFMPTNSIAFSFTYSIPKFTIKFPSVFTAISETAIVKNTLVQLAEDSDAPISDQPDTVAEPLAFNVPWWRGGYRFHCSAAYCGGQSRTRNQAEITHRQAQVKPIDLSSQQLQ